MQDIKLLQDERFNDESCMIYKVPYDRLPKRSLYDSDEIIEAVDFEHEETLKVIVGFIKHHKQKQVPRLQELERYFENKNNIKYRPKKPDMYRADNRIASDWVRFITTFKRGVVVGNPIEYSGRDTVINLLKDFNERSNIAYHDQMMVQDMVLYGRAYELPYRNQQAQESITKLDVMQTFIIYDTTVDRNSICGVHYFKVKYLNETKTIVELYGNDGFVYTFEAKKDDFDNLVLQSKRDTFTRAVSINEWSNNEERHGDSDASLDSVDAYDLAQSELANFMQDSSDAYLVIVGNPMTGLDENGKEVNSAEVLRQQREARMLVLGDKKMYSDGVFGAEPNAFYLKKEYDTNGAEAYKDRLVADILRFSFVVDFTDETLGGNQTGVGLKFKSWGNDNDRATKENVIRKAIMRRIRLLTSSWSLKETISSEKLTDKLKRLKNNLSGSKQSQSLYEMANDIVLKFNPNLPQSTEELVNNAKNVYGIVSEETVFGMLERITGVDVETEKKRLKAEQQVENSNPRRPESGENEDGKEGTGSTNEGQSTE